MKSRISITILFTILGATFAYLASVVRSGGLLVEWEALVEPPEKATQIVDLDYIRTDKDNIFHYSYVNQSWEKVQETIFESEYILLPLSACDTLPFLPFVNDFIDSRRACVAWGAGTSLFVFAIDKNGSVLTWNNQKGEYGGFPLLWAFCGAIMGL